MPSGSMREFDRAAVGREPAGLLSKNTASTFDLLLTRSGWFDRAVLCLVSDTLAALAAQRDSYLSEPELREYDLYLFSRRQHSFLLGRKAVRMALTHIPGAPVKLETSIARSVFQQPHLVGPGASTWDIGISHTGEWGGGLVFPRMHPMGLDVEAPMPERVASLWRGFTPAECVEALRNADGQATACALLWTAKEALVKALGCGLATPLSVFEVLRIIRMSDGWRADFVNFPQFQSRIVQVCGLYCAVALPAKTAVEFRAR